MKLTLKDREFLERLRMLLDEKDLHIELKEDRASNLRDGHRQRTRGVAQKGAENGQNLPSSTVRCSIKLSIMTVSIVKAFALRNRT